MQTRTLHASQLSSSDAASTPKAAAAAAASTEQTILVDRRPNGIVVLKFNRPSSLNAMTVRMGEQFQEIVQQLTKDDDVRCIVLTGEGKAFSAGGDLEFLLSRCNDSPHSNSTHMRAFYSRFLSLLSLPVPIIAAINGPAIGAGMCVATACDYRIAAAEADLGYTFVKLGLHPGMASTAIVPFVIGQQQAARLLLTGEIIKGKRALEIGLVGEVVATPADVLPAALKLAESIASNSPVAIRTLTTSLRMRHQNDLERALWREADAQAQSYATKELKENVQALINKTSNRNKKQ